MKRLVCITMLLVYLFGCGDNNRADEMVDKQINNHTDIQVDAGTTTKAEIDNQVEGETTIDTSNENRIVTYRFDQLVPIDVSAQSHLQIFPYVECREYDAYGSRDDCEVASGLVGVSDRLDVVHEATIDNRFVYSESNGVIYQYSNSTLVDNLAVTHASILDVYQDVIIAVEGGFKSGMNYYDIDGGTVLLINSYVFDYVMIDNNLYFIAYDDQQTIELNQEEYNIFSVFKADLMSKTIDRIGVIDKLSGFGGNPFRIIEVGSKIYVQSIHHQMMIVGDQLIQIDKSNLDGLYNTNFISSQTELYAIKIDSEQQVGTDLAILDFNMGIKELISLPKLEDKYSLFGMGMDGAQYKLSQRDGIIYIAVKLYKCHDNSCEEYVALYEYNSNNKRIGIILQPIKSNPKYNTGYFLY